MADTRILAHRACWPILVLAFCASVRVVDGGSATKALLGCSANTFFPVPTAWRGSTGYLVTATAASTNAYCVKKGFASAGASKKITLAKAKLGLTVLDVSSGAPCTGPRCQFLSAVECVPAGGSPCVPDGRGNVGSGNKGKKNFGHRNKGNSNQGSDNTGSNNVGNGNSGKKNIGCNGKGVVTKGKGLVNVGRATKDALQTFITCSDSQLQLPVPPISPPVVPACQLPVDLCVLMDGSASYEAWAALQTLAMTAVSTVGQPTGFLAVKQFSSSVITVVANTTMAQAGNAAAQITAAAPVGGTKTLLGQAVSDCKSTLMGFETGHAMRMVILLANNPFDATATQLSLNANSAQSAGVEIIAVGVGGSVDPKVLTTLASDASKALALSSYSSTATTAVATQLGNLICLAGKCQTAGTTTSGAGNKIYNGQAASWNQFPFIARISFSSVKQPGIYYLCTGSFIAPRVVVTAAHCAYEAKTVDPSTPAKMKLMPVSSVTVGMTTLDCKGNSPKRGGTAIPHPQWVPGFANLSTAELNDIAVIILDKPIPNIQPIQLVQAGPPPAIGLETAIAGWGHTKAAPALSTSRLMWADLITIACPSVASPTHFCIGPHSGQSNTSACAGDSGGPGFLPGNNPVLIGLISYGDSSCAQETVLTSISAVRAWIDSTMSANGVSF